MNQAARKMPQPASDGAPPPVRRKPPVAREDSGKLYADYQKIHPRSVKGRWRSLKTAAVYVLLAIYFLTPFLRWDRGPDAPGQAVLIDMPGRRAYFFGLEIWPQEVYYLTGLLILAAIALFFVSALFGRLWCGFACWQTVFTDLFVWVEARFEGDRNARIKFDRAGWSVGKLLRKAGKHAVWGLIAFATGLGFILYFNDAPGVIPQVVTGAASGGVYLFIAIIGGFCYLLAGLAREQVCIYMCPYSRFQAAMFDDDSLIVTYEGWRGEPRGPAKARTAAAFEGRGHCVDCRMCVQVCPTGIDIRDGNQLACIGCGLCIDACNGIMDKFGLPRGLITYDSVNNQVARSKRQPTRFQLLRPRTYVYVAVLSLVSGVMLYGLMTRDVTEINVLHERSPLYVTLSDGSIRNGYTFKIINKLREDKVYALRTEGIEGATMAVVGLDGAALTEARLPVKGDSVGSFQLYVRAPLANLDGGSTDLAFRLTDTTAGTVEEYDTLFAGPGR